MLLLVLMAIGLCVGMVLFFVIAEEVFLVWQRFLYSATGMMSGLLGILIPALGFVLICGLVYGLDYGEMGAKTTPNQGIRQSAKNAIIVFLVVELLFGVIGGLLDELVCYTHPRVDPWDACWTEIWRIGCHSPLYPACHPLLDRPYSLEVSSLPRLRHRAHLPAQGRRRLHLYPPPATGLLCGVVGEGVWKEQPPSGKRSCRGD